MKKILFVCTGNTCRSPMAEFIMKEKLNIYNMKEIEIKSAGVFVNSYGNAISQVARDALKNLYNIFAEHTATQLTQEMLEQADLVLCMEQKHVDIIKHFFGDAVAKNVFSFNAYVGIDGDILDPYGGDLEVYKKTAKEIERAIELLIKKEEIN